MLTYNANLLCKFALQIPLNPPFFKRGTIKLFRLRNLLIRGILTRAFSNPPSPLFSNPPSPLFLIPLAPFSNPPSPLFSKRGDYKLTYNANRYLNSPF